MATKDRTALKEEFKNGNLATGECFADLIDSMKVVQLPVVDPAASGTSLSFIDSISQDADGKITATKKTLDLSNAHELNPFKGWYKTGDTLPTDGFDGAYLYFKDTTEQTGLTTIYRWNGTAYADTGTVVDTSNVQTFKTGQAVNEVKIKDENGVEDAGAEGVLSAEAGENLRKTKAGVLEEQSSTVFEICDPQGNVIAKINNGFEVTGDGNIIIRNGFDSKRDKFKVGRAIVPHIDYKKTEFRWLDIGNSHSGCALDYLKAIAKSQGVDLSNVAFCSVARGGSSFTDWVAGYHDDDTDGGGDQLTGGDYSLVQKFGGLNVKISGKSYTKVNDVYVKNTTYNNANLTDTGRIVFYGGDCSILRSLLQDNEWDLITIHQRYIYNDVYDESNGWIDNLTEPILSGDSTTYISGGLNEFMNILRTTNPSAAIGYLFALVPFGYSDGDVVYNENSLAVTNNTFSKWSSAIKKFIGDSGVDFIIPCDTALENLRNSSVPNEPNEWVNGSTTPLNVKERWGFNYDKPHTVPVGVAAYTMSAVAWEMVFAPRFNKSIYGNSLHELKSNDNYIYSSGDSRYHLTIHPTYPENGVEQSTDYSGVWVGITKATVDSENEFSERATSTVRLTDDNRGACQMAAICAVNDMWNINTNLQNEI